MPNEIRKIPARNVAGPRIDGGAPEIPFGWPPENRDDRRLCDSDCASVSTVLGGGWFVVVA